MKRKKSVDKKKETDKNSGKINQPGHTFEWEKNLSPDKMRPVLLVLFGFHDFLTKYPKNSFAAECPTKYTDR